MSSIATGSRLGRYTIERSIGQGAFGEVFLAHYQGPGGFSRRVAVKVLLPEAFLIDQGLESFHREGRTAALLSHRNIIQVIDVGQQGEHHYLVMEHVDGINLTQLCQHVGPELPAWVRLAIILEIARGLAHAHALRLEECPQGVVHRDVKPSNILLGTGGDVKLSDFGLAKRFQQRGDQLTAAGMIKGTPGFMSPEQMTGEDSGAPNDIHALGAVLFWLYAGKLPRRQLGKRIFDDVREGAIPPGLEPIIEAAVHPVADKRPDAETLVRRLGEELAGLTPAGAVPNLAEEIGRWVGRARERASRGGTPVAVDGEAETLTDEGSGEPFQPAVRAEIRAGRRLTAARNWYWYWGIFALVAALGVVAGFIASGDLTADGCAGETGTDVLTPDAVVPSPDLAAQRPDTIQPAEPDMLQIHVDASPIPDAVRLDEGAPRDQRPPRRPPRPTKVRPPRGRGFLSVDSEPWSWVYLDGKRMGQTPLWRRPVAAGPHRLQLKGSHGGLRRRVQIAPGKHLNLGRIPLR